MITIFLEPILHRGENRVKLETKFNVDFISFCKKINYCRYSATLKRWHIPNKPKELNDFQDRCKDSYRLIQSKVCRKTKTKSYNFKPITKQDIRTVLENISDKRFNLMVQLAYSLGLRASEITRIKLEDINMKTLQLNISLSNGRISRKIKYHQSLNSSIQEYIKDLYPCLYLFEDHISVPVDVKLFYRAFKNACNQANIPNISIQSLRHNYAYQLYNKGTSLIEVQHLLGHRSIKTTQQFLNIKEKFDNQDTRNCKSLTIDQ